jgi:hypothetical protein
MQQKHKDQVGRTKGTELNSLKHPQKIWGDFILFLRKIERSRKIGITLVQMQHKPTASIQDEGMGRRVNEIMRKRDNKRMEYLLTWF